MPEPVKAPRPIAYRNLAVVYLMTGKMLLRIAEMLEGIVPIIRHAYTLDVVIPEEH